MLQQIRKAMKEESGFTLIELLIVIVILGILASIVVFGVAKFTSDGQGAACNSDWKNVEIASQAYYAQNHTYATGIGVPNDTSPTTLVGAGYLKEPPSTSNNYTITLSSTTGAVTATGACTRP